MTRWGGAKLKKLKGNDVGQVGIMNQAIKLMKKEKILEGEEKDEKKCFWLPDSKWWELFMCVSMKNLSPIFLFHYDRRNQLGLSEKLNQVSDINYSGPQTATMTFKNGQSANMHSTLKISLSWLRKWETIFTPEKHCKMEKKEVSSKEYTLTCDAENKKTGSRAWSRDVIPESV